MTQNHGSFIYWKNLSNALVPPDDQLGDEVVSQRWHLSGLYRYVLDNDRFITIKGIWFRNHFDDNIAGEISTEGNESISDFFDAEIQYNFALEKHQFTTGI